MDGSRFLLVALFLAPLALTTGLAHGGEALPIAPTAAQELHGLLHGQPFWVRLLPPDKQFGGNRILQLVYTPQPSTVLDGAQLSDCPNLLVDDHLCIVAWNGRDTGSAVVPKAEPAGYQVTRDVLIGTGAEQRVENKTRTIPGIRAWDLRLAPVLLALSWHPTTTATVRVIDLFGPRYREPLDLRWDDQRLTVAGDTWTIEPTADGQVARILAPDRTVLVEILGRK